MLKLSFLDKLPYVFLRNKNYKNGGNNKMAKPSFQNLRNKMFAPLSNDLSSFIGQTNFISKDIPEVQVALSSFMLNQDDDNTAYNLRNMYGGNPLGHVMNEVSLPLQRAFHLVREEFYVGIDINRKARRECLFTPRRALFYVSNFCLRCPNKIVIPIMVALPIILPVPKHASMIYIDSTQDQ